MVFLFRHGYEPGDQGYTGSVINAPNTRTVVTTPVFAGTHSAEIIASDGVWCEDEVMHGGVLGVNPWLYCQAQVRADTITMSNFDKFAAFSIAEDGGGSRARAMIYKHSDGSLHWRLQAYFGSGSQESGNLQPIVLSTWYCIELYYIRSVDTEQAKMWINGVLVSTLTGSTPVAEVINAIYMGFHDIGGVIADPDYVKFYIDNVISDSAYIGLQTGEEEALEPEPIDTQPKYVGDTVSKRFRFYDESDALIDPDAIGATVYTPAGLPAVIYDITDFVKEAVGVYTLTFNVPAAPATGSWRLIVVPSRTTGTLQETEAYVFEVALHMQPYGDLERVKRLCGLSDTTVNDRQLMDTLIDADRMINTKLEAHAVTVPLTAVEGLIRTASEYMAAGLYMQKNNPSETEHPFTVQGNQYLTDYIKTKLPLSLAFKVGTAI